MQIYQKMLRALTVLTLGSLSISPGLSLAQSQSHADFFVHNVVRKHATEKPFATDHIIVKYKGEQSFRLEPVGLLESVDGAVSRFKHKNNREGTDNNPEAVEYSEPDYIAEATMIPNDPYFSYQWNFANSSNKGSIQTPAAWDMSTGSGVTVAIIDTGVAYENYSDAKGSYAKAPDFANTCFVPGYDFVNLDAHPNDDNSHGTHVTGTVAQSTNNSTGTAGIAFNACIMPIKVLNSAGSGTYSAIANGITYAADHGAKVINMSLGGSSPSQTLLDAITYAYNKGVTIVAAAGNSSSSVPEYPAGYKPYVISVGATRFDEQLAPYSNFGPTVDVVAPGGDTSVDQNGDDYGDGILQQTFNPTTKNPTQFGYYFFQGTSMASPHVAGVAALILSKNSSSTPEQVKQILTSTAKDLGTAGRDDTYGYGLVNATAALNFTGTVTPPPPPPPPPPTNQSPVANAGPDQTGRVFRTVTFNGSGSLDPDGSITSYVWQFSDSVTQTGAIVSRVFSKKGTYTATLTVTDNKGATASDSAIIQIKN